MNQIKLDSVFINTTNKEGKPNVSKEGKRFTMVNISFEGKKASMYCDNTRDASRIQKAQSWKPGDTITVTLEQKGDFLNFNIPSGTQLLEIKVQELEKRVEKLEKMIDLDKLDLDTI